MYYKWEARLESGYYETKPKQVRRRKIDKDKLRQAIEEKPDMFLHELAQMFDCATQSVHNMLKKLGITRKKGVWGSRCIFHGGGVILHDLGGI